MVKLYKQVEEIVIANQTGPTTYLYPIYTYYFPLISDQIKKLTERIFEQDIVPGLPVSTPFYRIILDLSVRQSITCISKALHNNLHHFIINLNPPDALSPIAHSHTYNKIYKVKNLKIVPNRHSFG